MKRPRLSRESPVVPDGKMPWYAHLLCGWPLALFALFAALAFGWFGPFLPSGRVARGLRGDLLAAAGVAVGLLYAANAGMWKSRFPLRTRVAWIVGIGAAGVLIVGGAIALVIIRYPPP